MYYVNQNFKIDDWKEQNRMKENIYYTDGGWILDDMTWYDAIR